MVDCSNLHKIKFPTCLDNNWTTAPHPVPSYQTLVRYLLQIWRFLTFITGHNKFKPKVQFIDSKKIAPLSDSNSLKLRQVHHVEPKSKVEISYEKRHDQFVKSNVHTYLCITWYELVGFGISSVCCYLLGPSFRLWFLWMGNRCNWVLRSCNHKVGVLRAKP
jgi:hypothetical protein